MPKYTLQGARTVGKGHHAPPGSLKDAALADAISRYKRGIASRYDALLPDELDQLGAIAGGYYVSPKIDGEQWCLVLDEGEAFFANPNGRVLAGDIPVIVEARKLASRTAGITVIAGELYATRESGRSRHGDLAAALGTDGKSTGVDRVRFSPFDIVWGGDAKARMPIGEYKDRLELLHRLFDGTDRLRPVQTKEVADIAEISALYEDWAADGKAEGLVVRPKAIPKVYKVKPSITLDVAVIGYTLSSVDASRCGSLLMALIRDDGQFQVIGHCGNLGTEDARREWLDRVRPLECESNYSEANSRGAMFQLVRPELVIEVRISDVQAEGVGGEVVPRMVLAHEGGRWVARQRMPGVSVLHPRLERLRDDKRPIAADVPMRQVLDRVLLPDADKAARTADLPKSEILRRQVFTKAAKDKTAVRKLLVWRTHKEQLDSAYPAYVVCFIDYSAGRKDPLQRTVRLAPSLELASRIAEGFIESEIKKGWVEVG